VDKSSQGSASKSKGGKDDSESKFVRPLPVTPKAKKKSSGRKRVSESVDSTTVAGKLIKTDDYLQPSRVVSRTEDQKGSQLECATEVDCLFGSPGSKLHRELAKNRSICCKEAIYYDFSNIMKIVMMVAGNCNVGTSFEKVRVYCLRYAYCWIWTVPSQFF